ncbi:hypothetical protein [Methylocaldum szegediense]|uniref:hypothetical protein n=1 Tax=Methylocaldum szegediense TaxID=73780 RepID=UPI00295EC60E|nr:hypothetical protein [Methylocaldum szegediense]
MILLRNSTRDLDIKKKIDESEIHTPFFARPLLYADGQHPGRGINGEFTIARDRYLHYASSKAVRASPDLTMIDLTA